MLQRDKCARLRSLQSCAGLRVIGPVEHGVAAPTVGGHRLAFPDNRGLQCRAEREDHGHAHPEH